MAGFVGPSVSLLLFILCCGSSIGAYFEGEETSKHSTESEPTFDWVGLSEEEAKYRREPRARVRYPTSWTHIPYNCTHDEYCGIQFYDEDTRMNRSDVLIICYCQEGKECAFLKDFMWDLYYGYRCRNITDSSSSTSQDSNAHANIDGITEARNEVDATVDGAETANTGGDNGSILRDRIGTLGHAEL